MYSHTPVLASLGVVEDYAIHERAEPLQFCLTDFPKVVIKFVNPEQLHPELGGYRLAIYGVLFPTILHRSQYPWISFLDDDNGPVATIVILSTCVFQLGSSVVGWVIWGPQLKSLTVNTNFSSSDGDEEAKLQTCLCIIRRGFGRGRPIGSGNHSARNSFKAKIDQAIADLQAQGLTKVGQMEVAEKLNLSRSRFSELLKHHKLPWNTLKP